jgi:lysophospholipase L1-like esterase
MAMKTQTTILLALCSLITANISIAATTIPQQNWSVWYVDSEEIAAENGMAENVFDGNAGTFWHTEWYNSAPTPPHEISIDLGGVYDISGFRYLPRQDGATNGNIASYEFYVSADGLNWGSPVASGSFAAGASEREVSFTPARGQFIRLKANSEINGKPWTAVSEINVVGVCSSPSVRITSPLSYAVLPSTTIRTIANACLDPTLYTGWGVRFTLDGVLSVNDYTPPYEATFSGVGYSNHTIQAALIDAYGNMAAGLDAFDQVEQVGIGDYYVAVGDSITFGLGDNISYDNASGDGRNTGGGYEPILNDLLTAVKGYPHTIVNQGRPGYTSSLGLKALPLILQRYSNAKYFLIQYGTNDPGVKIKSGVGLELGDYGYYGSFKDNMQRMIDLVRSKGKEPLLAKVPYALGSYSSRNAWYLEYNEAIDELALSNALKADPPDLYGYFITNEDEYSDYLHPNGYGYRSIADLWFSSLY